VLALHASRVDADDDQTRKVLVARSAASGYLPLTASMAMGRPPSSRDSSAGSTPNAIREAPSRAMASADSLRRSYCIDHRSMSSCTVGA
jgi:hypothetical protein